MADGRIGSSGSSTEFNSPKSLNCTMGSNEYPSGTITFTNIAGGGGHAYWRNQYSSSQSLTLYLCDSAGNNAVQLFTLSISGKGTNTSTKTATVNAPGLVGKALYIKGSNTLGAIMLVNQTGVTIETASTSLSVTCNASAGGSLSASTSSATPGSTVTLYPSPNTGYYLTGYTSSPSVSISNNKFTMPNSAVTITANFAKISYTISKGTSPSGAGTVTTSPASSATMWTSVTVSQTPATGYYFNGWQTSPALTISGGAFTMPASNVSITAKYLKRSTASLSKSSMAGGSTVTMTITSESSAYTHKYTLSFGTGMTTGEVSVAAGVTSVTISNLQRQHADRDLHDQQPDVHGAGQRGAGAGDDHEKHCADD